MPRCYIYPQWAKNSTHTHTNTLKYFTSALNRLFWAFVQCSPLGLMTVIGGEWEGERRIRDKWGACHLADITAIFRKQSTWCDRQRREPSRGLKDTFSTHRHMCTHKEHTGLTQLKHWLYYTVANICLTLVTLTMFYFRWDWVRDANFTLCCFSAATYVANISVKLFFFT